MGEDPSQKTQRLLRPSIVGIETISRRGKNLFAYVIKELGHHADTYCIDEF